MNSVHLIEERAKHLSSRRLKYPAHLNAANVARPRTNSVSVAAALSAPGPSAAALSHYQADFEVAELKLEFASSLV
jgi:hypothetical protein